MTKDTGRRSAMKMDRKCWLNRVIVCFLMMIIIIQIPMHAYPDEKRTVAIGTNAEYAPFEYLDSNGDLTGFDIDLMNAIAKEPSMPLCSPYFAIASA